ncbi:MAG: tRNA (adenosine(37)-N6)-dimethylallyltransferase MiaA [Candidatus Pacebacteria bacterium]|nr:tRNA (adenosine(37)-N6)-dimethylallyltransferase MiaA [Candidatus Paceibacterota bacterium]MBP9772923.1 tRNA (adenosine(37)-N6)-dimethylallyltransferase MiaA [Candidatus Paceibacterota bacterium]
MIKKQAKKLPVISITGPTSSGKTGASIALAKYLNKKGVVCEIVSADSRQVYRGLDLLSGKVTKKEMGKIPHHMLSVVNPKKVYSVSDFKKDAEQAIGAIHARGNLPVLVGGTGFYIDAITKGVVLPEVPPNNTLRKKLEKYSTLKLCETLKKLDKKRYEKIDTKNRVRLIRAIEIATALGKVPKLETKAKYEVFDVYIDLPDEILKANIRTRLLERLKAGMIREAKKLHDSGISWKRMDELGLECRYVALHLQGKISKNEMIIELEKSTWQYVKRQRTWFKKK